mgnify:CR=1 FL=1
MPSRPTDDDLVDAARAGSAKAFAELVERHGGRVRSTLLRLTSDPDRADDLAQDTFLRAYRGLAGFRGEARFGTWILQIAVHAARDGLRQKQRRDNVVSLDELRERRQDVGDPVATGAWSDPTDAVGDHELAARLAAALETLPPSYREVFVLHHQRDLSYEEIARMTGDSVGSLKVRAHRARQLLKERVFDDEPSNGASTSDPTAPHDGREGGMP